MLGTRLRITPYSRQHRNALLDLTWTSQWTHKHLDWYEAGQWLDGDLGLTLLAWQGEELVGYIGVSNSHAGSSWVRLLGIRDGRMPGLVINELWECAEAHCLAHGITNITILMVTNWLSTYLARHGFYYLEDIITMSHIGSRPPAEPLAPVTVRPAETGDIPRILEIDHGGFQPIWQLTQSDVWQALRISTNATVAAQADYVVAYQLSTRHEDVGHLARLAVDPAHQRQRIASLLMHRLLEDLQQKQVETISVNTQVSNLPSQHLYQRYGFFRNGYDIELWHKQLA